MIKVEKGKLCMGKVSFALPDGFYFSAQTNYECEEGVCLFIEESKTHLFLGIEACENTPKEELASIADGEFCFARSDDFVVERTGKQGAGLYYSDEDGNGFYEERFALEGIGEKQFVLRLQTPLEKREAVAILQSVLQQKKLSAFLRTIAIL